eukprot:scaffold110857_cov72-Phaeocystis_antarctica.AAC.1
MLPPNSHACSGSVVATRARVGALIVAYVGLVGFVVYVARHGGGGDSDGDPARRLRAAAEG